MHRSFLLISKVFVAGLLAMTVISGAETSLCASAPPSPPVRLGGHIPSRALAVSKLLGRLPADTNIPLAFVLPLRNQSDLQGLLGRMYDPADPQFGHYLTPQEFTDRFGPTQADYDAVAAYARSRGLTVSATHHNRLLLNVSAPAGKVETAFNLRLQRYQGPGGREFYTPDNGPEVPDSIASRIVGVVGLDNAAVWRPHSRFVSSADLSGASPLQIGSGPGGGLTPNDILTAYNLKGVTPNGSGQTLALFELDGYRSSDVASYVSYFSLPSVPLQNVLLDGFSGTPGSGASEVTLDIELQIALAPGAGKILVYEAPNSSIGVIDTYNRIATDNLAKQISTSWGLSEGESSSTVINSENAAFQQMAAQGQSIYAASGDNGAYDNGTTLGVDDPASQPYVVGVGGTKLFVNANKTYNYETTWNYNNTASGGAGGGGVSTIWGIPSWQKGISTAASTTMRNVPDISLDADPHTGYSIYYNGAWTIYGGTSCAAPLWSAFTARVNQQRAANGNSALGFANPAIYQLAKGAGYGSDFHDVTQGTNLYYAAVTGYDNATGWGSFNGANLLADLAPPRTFTLTYSAGDNGTIVGVTPQTVNYGGSGSQVTALASAGYHFLSWSDGVASVSRTDTNVTANIAATASFASDPYAQIVGNAQVFYGLLQSAYNSAATDAVIKAQAITFNENLSVDNATSVTLSGGWDPTFSTQNGDTVLQGSLTISQGTLSVNHLVIRSIN